MLSQGRSKSRTIARFVNAPEDSSQDAIRGHLLTSPVDLAVVHSGASVHVIARSNWQRDKVAVVSTGGLGHEPGDIEYVGEGMLTAVACGSTWRVSTADEIAHSIMAVTGEPGCLLIITNYIAVQLNAQLAVEKATKLGLKVKVVNVKDDVVSRHNHENAGPARGIAGVVLVQKIAGAAANAGLDLEAVCREAEEAAMSTRTIGVAYSRGQTVESCAVTAKAESNIPEGFMEVGIGVHGEPGWMSYPATAVAAEIVDMMVTKLKALSPETGPLCVMLNNLGAVPRMEMAIMAKHVMESALGPRIRLFAGPAQYYTALNTNGFSLSVIPLSELREERLLAPTECRSWVMPVRPRCFHNDVVAMRMTDMPRSSLGTDFHEPSDHPVVRGLLLEVVAAIIEVQDELSSLSARTGTGKLGGIMAAFMRSLRDDLDYLPLAEPVHLFAELSKRCSLEAGVIFSISNKILHVAAKELESQDGWELAPVVSALRKGTAHVQQLSGIALNRRTFLDALVPALSCYCGDDMLEDPAGMQWRIAAARLARRGARATAHMIHASDWAAYTPLAARAGVPDGGAVAIATIFTALETPTRSKYRMLPDSTAPLSEEGVMEKAEERAWREFLELYNVETDVGDQEQRYIRRTRLGTAKVGPHSGQSVAISEVRREDWERLKMQPVMDAVVMDQRRMRNWLFRRKRHIVDLFELIVTPNSCLYIMERLYGHTLMRELESKGSMTYQRIAELLRQVLVAVTYLHDSRLIHRDLKPESFRFESETGDVLKLTDVCGMISHLSQSYLLEWSPGVVCGTLAYMSPEALEGFGRQAGDMWSVGVILHLMLSHELPFKASSIEEMQEAHERPVNVLQGDTHARWEGVPSTARDLVQRLLERNARSRMTVHEALHHDFVASADGLNGDAGPTHNAGAALLSPGKNGAYQDCFVSSFSEPNWHKLKAHSPKTGSSTTKTIYLIRHGEAIHNIEEKSAKKVAAEECLRRGLQRGSSDFNAQVEAAAKSVLHNPEFYDATLSSAGKLDAARCACELQGLAKRGLPMPTVVFTSPLQRTLQTAATVFPYHSSVHALEELRERRTGLPCDSRRSTSEMSSRRSFQCIDFNHIVCDFDVIGREEDKSQLRVRCSKFLKDLPTIQATDEFKEEREHSAICIVTHKGFLRELERGPLGHPEATEFANCEVRVYEVKWDAAGNPVAPAKCLYNNAALCTLEMRNFPASWVAPEALPELPRKVEAMLAEFGELRETPELVADTPGGDVRVNATFVDQNAASAANRRLDGLDARSQTDKALRPLAYESERLWARVRYDTDCLEEFQGYQS